MPDIITKEIAYDRLRSKYPDWELIEFNSTKGPCIVKHKCGNIKHYKIYESVLKNGPRCGQCEDTINWMYEIGEVMDNIQITNRKFVVEDGVRRSKITKLYQYKCLHCGFDESVGHYIKGIYKNESWSPESSIKSGKRCLCCGHVAVQPGINDIQTTDPLLVDYFLNKNEAKMYSRCSDHHIQSKCPICGFIQPNTIKIKQLVLQGKECFNCGSSFSYPEKFMYFMLRQLGVEFIMHKTFDWSKNIVNDDGTIGDKEYDFYLPGRDIIIETHGRQHYDSNVSFSCYSARGRTLDEEQANDALKEMLAIQNKYIYIVINSSISTKEWMTQQIVNSELNNLFDLNNVDWEQCNKDALGDFRLNIILDRMNNPQIKISELSKKYGFSVSTITRWLKQGSELSGYSPRMNIETPIYSPELDFAFNNVKQASDKLGMWPAHIYGCLNGRTGCMTAGKHPMTGTPLTWMRWDIKQYNEWLKQEKCFETLFEETH